MRWLFALFVFFSISTAFAQSELPTVTSTDIPVSTLGQLQSALQNLANNTSFKNKADAIDALVALNHERVLPVLKALVDGNLYLRKGDSTVVVGLARDADVVIYDALTGTSHGSVEKSDLAKIGINNTLRKQLKTAIARLSLSVGDVTLRRAAVTEMMKNLDSDALTLLRDALPREKDPETSVLISTALAMEEVSQGDKANRLRAIEILGANAGNEARSRLAVLVERKSDGSFVEEDAEIRAAATTALESVDRRLAFYSVVETTFFGLSLGSVLLLAAIGLAITFGVMGVINMAHGELIMLGAYTTYVVQSLMPNAIDASLFVAIPAAFVVSGLVGIAIERGVIRYLYGRSLETLLATFGVSLILQQAVRSIFSPLNRQVDTPSWMSGSVDITHSLSLTYNRIYVLVFSLLLFVALLLLLKKTVFGLQMRAVTQNRDMARAMGIRTNWVDALTFGLGSGIAGIAGVALSQLTNVGPNLGQAYIIDSFMVVVFGGVGNLWGTLVGAMSLGVINKILEPWSGAVLAKILVLVAIILFIQKRPRGLFPQKGRTAEG